MLNRQILADHFNGKRDAMNPEVQREFQLLRQQAEIDWSEMYDGKDTRVTAQSIEEDYIYNAQSFAKIQLMLKRAKTIVVVAVLAAVALIYVLKK